VHKDRSRNGRDTIIRQLVARIARAAREIRAARPLPLDSRQELEQSRTQYSVELIIRNKAHGSTEGTFIGTAVALLKCALVVLVALIEWDNRVEIQISTAINDCKK